MNSRPEIRPSPFNRDPPGRAALASMGRVCACRGSGSHQIIVQDAPVGQGQIGYEVTAADDALDRQVGHRSIDVRDKVKPRGADPRPLYGYVRQIVSDELGDLRSAVDVRDQLKIGSSWKKVGIGKGTIMF